MADALVIIAKRIRALEERVKFLSRKDGERSNKHKQLTIAAGEVDVQDRTYYKLHPETGTADDLDTINGGQDGYLVSLQIAVAGDTITLKDGTGNLALNGDLVLNTVDDVAYLLYNAAEATWCVIGFNHSTGGLVDADTLQGHPASDFVFVTDYEDLDVLNKVKNVDGPGSGLNADLLDDLDSTAFALVVHTHDASDIVSGTLDDARIPTGITRDSEVFGIVLANDGPGSGLDADVLDGLDSSAFALSSWHTHRMSVDTGTRTIATGYSLVVPEFEVPSGMVLEIASGGILMVIG